MSLPINDCVPQTGPKPRFVAFDVVGTLIYPQPAAGEVYFQAARKHGSRLSQEQVLRGMRQAFHLREQSDVAAGAAGCTTSEIHEEQRWASIVAAAISDVPAIGACFREIYEWFARPEAWKCFDDVPEALERLRQAGFGLALATNYDQRLHAVCTGLPPLAAIPLRVISASVGHRKPGVGFYRALLEATRCAPAELLMVGDDFTNDVCGARQSGISALHLTRNHPPAEGTISSLTELANLLTG